MPLAATVCAAAGTNPAPRSASLGIWPACSARQASSKNSTGRTAQAHLGGTTWEAEIEANRVAVRARSVGRGRPSFRLARADGETALAAVSGAAATVVPPRQGREDCRVAMPLRLPPHAFRRLGLGRWEARQDSRSSSRRHFGAARWPIPGASPRPVRAPGGHCRIRRQWCRGRAQPLVQRLGTDSRMPCRQLHRACIAVRCRILSAIEAMCCRRCAAMVCAAKRRSRTLLHVLAGKAELATP